MLHMATPLDTSDALLMSDDERTAFLSPDPNAPICVQELFPTRIGISGYRGVNRSGRDRFNANVYKDTVRYYLGTFDTAIDAARAYDAKARELHGDYAILNFPDDPTPADIEDAANEPLLSLVEVPVAPDDSYDALDLDPDLYRYGVAATEAETMAAPFDWDAMTEGAAA